ncbi:MAG: DNA methyltransferase [bacterium]|nr:DNA methyltransferase [bacterium]
MSVLPIDFDLLKTLQNIKIEKDLETILHLDPKTILVREGLERYRIDLTQLEELYNSIKKFGQLAPIIITENYELIAGGRRLASCLEYKASTIACVIKKAVSNDLLREIELEENIQRQGFTPAEYALAIYDLHYLKCSIYGTIKPGQKKSSGWTMEKTAALINKTQAHVTQQLQIAERIKEFPALAKCETATEINAKVKSLDTQISRAKGLVKFEKEHSDVLDKIDNFLFCRNFRALEIAKSSIDFILTDPPYNINISNIALSATGKTGNDLATIDFKDYWSQSDRVSLVMLSARYLKPTGHFLAFCSIEQFNEYKSLLEMYKFLVYPRPLIFTKSLGTSNNPDLYPLPRYEIAIFARRPQAKLVESFIDIMPLGNVTNKQHINEKPAAIAKYLCQKIVLPNSLVLDFCMGSGNLLVGALQAKMRIVGCDNSKQSFDLARTNIINYLKSLV